ncbi:MAG: hypothetical protein H6668_19520 [Ardenticatenaceae bacterium]|nr:hypothetical protein [Ardenticatenaceae bacterium]
MISDSKDAEWQQHQWQALAKARQLREQLAAHGLFFDSTKMLQEVREERLEELLSTCLQTKNSNTGDADQDGLNGSEKNIRKNPV